MHEHEMGVPVAIASQTTIGNPTYQREGTASAIADCGAL